MDVSVITPTLNSDKTIRECLFSIAGQDYQEGVIEVIITDGGSSDKTIEIIKSIGLANLKILPNHLKTGEAGKAIGVKAAKGEIVAFIDSDNMLPDKYWLKRMVEPFSEPEIIASEPIEYTYRKTDGYITRYCALMGMNDPLCFFLGNYDRRNTISGKWTQMRHAEEDRGNYLKVELDKRYMPTIGANGFLIRRTILDKYKIGDYLFDIDVLYELSMSHDLTIAKVKVGIIHIFAGGIKDFMHKQRRRIRDYAYYKKLGLRKYEWGRAGVFGLIKFILYCVLPFLLLIHVIIGYTKKRDVAWFYHIPACLITFFVYTFATIQNYFIQTPLSRKDWK